MTWAEHGARLVESGALPQGFPARDAAWLATVGLNGGLFLRSQYEAALGVNRAAAQRLVERLAAAGAGSEIDGGAGFGRYFHVTGRAVYRALGMGDSRLRRNAGRGISLQRLLALDCVVAHPELRWRAGREGALAALRGQGVPDEALPRRVYPGKGGAAGATVLLPARWPVALDERSSVWAFPDSGQSAHPRLDLRTWGRQHAPAWRALQAGGASVRVLFVTRSARRAAAVGPEFRAWNERGLGGAAGPNEDEVVAAAAEIEKIKTAFSERDNETINSYGGLNEALRRLTPLEQIVAGGRGGGGCGALDAAAWISDRLQLRGAIAGEPEPDLSFEVRRL